MSITPKQSSTPLTQTANRLEASAITLLKVPNVLGGERDADAVHPRLFLTETLRLNVGHGWGSEG